VCENNLYATESPLQLRQPVGTELCERMRAFKIDASRIDGNDVHEVYRAAQSALNDLRAGAGPFFLEMGSIGRRPCLSGALPREGAR